MSGHIDQENNFALEQRNWNAFETLGDAETGLQFKQPAKLVYIISEDTWYYWKDDIDEFVVLAGGGGGGGSAFLKVQDTVELAAIAEAGLVDKDVALVEDDNVLYRYDAEAVSGDVAPDDQTGGTGFWIQLSSAVEAADIFYDNSSSGLTANDVQAALDELGVQGETWNYSGSRDINNTTDVYLRRINSMALNLSPYIVPQDGVIYAVSAGTRVAESWTAEVRIDTGGGFAVVAGLVIAAADKGALNGLAVNVNQGDKLALYCNGTGIDRPTIDVYLKSR